MKDQTSRIMNITTRHSLDNQNSIFSQGECLITERDEAKVQKTQESIEAIGTFIDSVFTTNTND